MSYITVSLFSRTFHLSSSKKDNLHDDWTKQHVFRELDTTCTSYITEKQIVIHVWIISVKWLPRQLVAEIRLPDAHDLTREQYRTIMRESIDYI